MTKEERINKIKEAQTKASEAKHLLSSIVWVDNLDTSEQIALTDIFGDAVHLESSINSYLHWLTN